MIGRPPISSRSFANASMLPENETLPIRPESTIETDSFAAEPPRVRDRVVEVRESATSAAAPPPTPLNSATISGIAVIFTARAA